MGCLKANKRLTVLGNIKSTHRGDKEIYKLDFNENVEKIGQKVENFHFAKRRVESLYIFKDSNLISTINQIKFTFCSFHGRQHF